MDASTKLQDLGEGLLQSSHQPATLLGYHKNWCKLMVVNLSCALPISTKILWLFALYMHYSGMKEGISRVALSGIAFVHKINNLADHSRGFLILRA